MIKVNELRVGNLVISEAGVVRNVTGHDIKEQWWHEGDPHGSDGASINPIPLTPEWLEKLGYKKDSMDGKWYKSPHHMPPIYNWRKGDYGMDGLPLIAKSIQYVHQLQNLYFTLTGEELNVKL